MNEKIEDVACVFISHILKQHREAFTEIWILRHLLHQATPDVPMEHWNTVIKHMMEHSETNRKVRDPFDKEAEKVIAALDQQIALIRTKQEVADAERKVDELTKEFIELASKLPDKLPN
jgi:ABC-type sugar transport system ATPase subunit